MAESEILEGVKARTTALVGRSTKGDPTPPSSSAGSRGDRIALLMDTLSAVPVWAGTPFVRPWHMRWGATDAEVAAAMPGDGVVHRAQFNATRAITIGAPPELVWPWIIQLGYGRAGFYTYDLVDNGGERSADRVIDEYQGIQVGKLIPMFHLR